MVTRGDAQARGRGLTLLWRGRCLGGAWFGQRDDQPAHQRGQPANRLYNRHALTENEQGEDGGEERRGLIDRRHLPRVEQSQPLLLAEIGQAEVGDDIERQNPE